MIRLRETIINDESTTDKEKIQVCKRLCRDLMYKYIKEQGNRFLWIYIFSKDICTTILDYIVDLNDLINIGLVCKIWWKGDTCIKNTFSILKYMQNRFKPNIPIIPRSYTTHGKLFHFEGLQPGYWAYDPNEMCYVIIKGHAKVFIRPIIADSLYFDILFNDNTTIDLKKISKKYNGKLHKLNFSAISARFRKEKWNTPQKIVIRCHKRKQRGKEYQEQYVGFMIKVLNKTTSFRLQKKIQNNQNINLKLIKKK